MFRKIFIFLFVVMAIFSENLATFALKSLSETEKQQIEILQWEIEKIKAEEQQWDKNFTGNLDTPEWMQDYIQGISAFENQITEKLEEIMLIKWEVYQAIPGMPLSVPMHWLSNSWENLTSLPEVEIKTNEIFFWYNIIMITLSFILIFSCIFLFFYNEKIISKNPNYKPKFLQIFWRFLRIVVFPSVIILSVFLIFSGIFWWWKIFIENMISENFDGKIIYKQWERIFYEEKFVITPHEAEKIVIPSGFSEWEIFVKISQNEKFSEISWGIDELYTRPPNVKVFIKKENEKINLEKNP